MGAIELEPVLERLAIVLETETGVHPYEKDIAGALGISPAALSNMKSRKRVPHEEIALFAAERKISINWLLFGQSPRKIDETMNRVYKIRFLSDVRGSAGGGAFNEEETEDDWLILDEKTLRALGLSDAKNLEAIRVIGDSMEPLLKDDSIVLIDRSRTEVGGGGIFAVNVLGRVFVKRVAIGTKGDVELISENPAYETIRENPEDVTVIGKIVGTLEQR